MGRVGIDSLDSFHITYYNVWGFLGNWMGILGRGDFFAVLVKGWKAGWMDGWIGDCEYVSEKCPVCYRLRGVG